MDELKSIPEAATEGGLVSIANVMDDYRCHKQVKAAVITSVAEIDGGMSLIIASCTDPELELPYAAPDDMLTRYRPVPGDYLVMYDGGYVAISPKQAFEDGYRQFTDSRIPAYQQRVIDEKAELDSKIGKLKAFVDTDKFKSLSQPERHRLERQLTIMTAYSYVLGERILAAFTE